MVNGRQYDEFIQKPFLRCKDKMMVDVVFDDADRYAPKIILEEELLTDMRTLRSSVVV